MHMSVDSVKPKLGAMRLLCRSQRIECNLPRLAQQKRRVYPRNTGIQPSCFQKAVQCLELPHAIPFHSVLPGIIYCVASAGIKQSPYHSCEHSLALFGRMDSFDIPREIQRPPVRNDLADRISLQFWKTVWQNLNLCRSAEGYRLSNPMISIPMCHIAWKSMVPERSHIVPEGVSVDPVQNRKRPFIEADRFVATLSTQL